jgi:hypothetical protein
MRQRLYNNKDHADLAHSLNNIGVKFERLGKYEESLKRRFARNSPIKKKPRSTDRPETCFFLKVHIKIS